MAESTSEERWQPLEGGGTLKAPHGQHRFPHPAMVFFKHTSSNDANQDTGIHLRRLGSRKPPLPGRYWLNLALPGPLRLAPAEPTRRKRSVYDSNDPLGVSLDGNVLLCRCPECGAPMSLRLWLSVADCWQCDLSIALTVEQVRALSGAAAPALPPDTLHRETTVLPKPPTTPPSIPVSSSQTRPQSPEPTLQPVRRRKPVRRIRPVKQPWWRSLPAWMVSGVLHMIALALLALLFTEATRSDPTIVLSTEVSPMRREGGPQDLQVVMDEVKFDLPIPPDVQQQTEPLRMALIRADQDARELRLDPSVPHRDLPDLERVKQTIVRSDSRQAMLAARDPRVRVEMIRQEGGTTLTEAAVSRGLRWLHLHQSNDGSWSLDRFHHTRSCDGRCHGHATLRSDAAATALVLLPFLGAGQTHLVGRYQDSVSLGLRWLIEHQEPDGDLRADSEGNSGMYAHGQAAIVLCEAYAMTGDAQLQEPAQRAVDFIVAAQHEAGGWRYRPGEPGDTSVLGWQLMALQSARAADLEVPQHVLENAGHFLDTVADFDGVLYAYMHGKQPTPVMTAEALLCRMYLGWDMSHVGLRNGVDQLIEKHLPDRGRSNFYYWYYGTQVMHHVGGAAWREWNHSVRDVLVDSQETSGHQAGSWEPQGQHDVTGGRLYTTALATCTLEVYYRHVPIFRQIEL